MPLNHDRSAGIGLVFGSGAGVLTRWTLGCIRLALGGMGLVLGSTGLRIFLRWPDGPLGGIFGGY